MSDPTTPEYAAARDADDPLAGLRDRFLGAETPLVYFDGNSLGPLPRAAPARMERAMRDEWGAMLIGGWNAAGWMAQPTTLGDRVGHALADHAVAVHGDPASGSLCHHPAPAEGWGGLCGWRPVEGRKVHSHAEGTLKGH